MKKFSLLLFACSLLSFTAADAFAQKKRYCPTPPPSPYKHTGQIVTSFDPAGGMRTTLQHPRALGGGADGLYLAASFVHRSTRAGTTGAQGQTVDIAFSSASKVIRFRDAHDLVFVADGQTIPFVGSAARYRSQATGDGLTLETTGANLPLTTLLTITRARRVAARVGGQEFELSNNHLEALRELASLISPATQGSWSTQRAGN